MSAEPSPSIGEGPFHKLPSPPRTPQRNSQATLQALDEDFLPTDKFNDVSININEADNEQSSGEESADVAEVAIREAPKHGWRTYAAFGTLCLVTFIVALDSTIICVAVPTIAQDIDATAIQAFWCGTSFLLASTVIQPPVASLSHVFGRQPALLGSLLVFTVGSILAAVAKNIAMLLAGRTLQGLGSGGIVALTYVIVTDLVSLRERGKWFSCISLTWTIGSIMGPLIGGAIVEKSWPWLFWINLPFCAIGFVVIPLTLRIKRKDDKTAQMKLKEFDWIGTVLFVASLTSVLIPLSWGGVMYSWSSPRTAVPLAVGCAGIVAFGFHIMHSSKYSRCDPLIRPTLFSSLTSVTGYCVTIIHGIIAWCLLYYVPMYHEVRGASPLDAGIAILPFTGTVAPGAIIIGLLVTKTGLYRPYLWGGWFFVPIGLGLLMLLEKDTPTWKWIIIYLTGGIGLGGLYSAQAFVCQAGASNEDTPFAAALYAFSRNLGQAIGVAVGGVTFQNQFEKQIKKSAQFSDKATEWSKNASALVEIIKKLPPNMELMKDTIVDGYIKSLHTVWLVLCVLASLALLASVVLVKAKSLDRDFGTEHGLVDSKGRKYDEKTPEGQV
ncbi:major facilitator superfamily domain-containing protein [Thelonectria olida]|uniref:Major facilitator superfamily domain-containing protein n=1 Tax=Thelonectria olida TaxID=1576542 RepID=A0A9P8WEV2_9HYPO|nr:major facilitator superfamily domain-containing protein [Thelonectria olida]